MGPEGARLGYLELDGDGPALVFLHGLGACSAIYFARTAIEPVLAGRRALMIDFLGFGISDRPAGFGYTLEDHADSIARALDTLGLEGVDMVAHSMGGSIALVLASRRPDLVGRLVLFADETALDPETGLSCCNKSQRRRGSDVREVLR